ncbi:ATP-binding protein [candidate division KSB1 bacterium]|nr:ATP-binding protein [candidate division KSB1 bacterium]
MSKDKMKYQLKIPSITDNLELIRMIVSTVAEKVGFNPDDVSKIELAVDEACANVIKHAYSKDQLQPIDLVIEIDYKKMAIVVTDHGKGFDFTKMPQTDVKEYLAEMRVGGLGIYLMKALMDEVEFNSQPGMKTQVKMVKYFLKNGELELAKDK